jgi:hypothetical protein
MLTLVTQTYLLAYLLIVPVGLLIVIFWQRIPKRALAIGIAIFAAASLFYAIGLLRQFESVQQNLAEFGSSPAHLSIEAWNHAVRLISGADYPLARGQAAPMHDAPIRQQLTQIAHFVVQALLIVGIGRAIGALRDPQRRTQAVILLMWFGVPILLMSYVGQPVHPFYQLLGLPAGCTLVAWSLDGFKFRETTPPPSLPRIRGRCRVSGGGGSSKSIFLLILFVPFAALMAINSARFAQETAAAPGVHDLGALPLDYGLQLGRLINNHLPANGVVYAEVDEWTLNSFAGTTFPLRRDTRAPRFAIIPRDGGAYVVGHITAPADWQPPAGTTIHKRIPLPGNGLLTVDVYPADATQQISPAHVVEQSSEEGLTLLGYDWEESTLVTYWRVDALVADANGWQFAPFAQVYDEQGERLAVIDGEIVPGRLWRVGDVHRHEMNLPPETAEISSSCRTMSRC